jgi:hypothetical protein
MNKLGIAAIVVALVMALAAVAGLPFEILGALSVVTFILAAMFLHGQPAQGPR